MRPVFTLGGLAVVTLVGTLYLYLLSSHAIPPPNGNPPFQNHQQQISSIDQLSPQEIEAIVRRELNKYRNISPTSTLPPLDASSLSSSSSNLQLVAEMAALKQQVARMKPIVSSVLRGKKFADKIPHGVREEVDRIASRLNSWPKLRQMFKDCFVSTLDTTVYLLDDGTTHVITGDIPAMYPFSFTNYYLFFFCS